MSLQDLQLHQLPHARLLQVTTALGHHLVQLVHVLLVVVVIDVDFFFLSVASPGVTPATRRTGTPSV